MDFVALVGGEAAGGVGLAGPGGGDRVEAGREFVRMSGARSVPGREFVLVMMGRSVPARELVRDIVRRSFSIRSLTSFSLLVTSTGLRSKEIVK